SEPYQHSYPHCWRCHTPLLYYALPSWFIRTTQIKDRLLAENERTNWQPPTIKYGRYGEGLGNNGDRGRSANRGVGTPAPPVGGGGGPAGLGGGRGGGGGTGRARPVRPGPAPPVRRRGGDQLPGVRRPGAAGPRGHRRLVRLRLHAVRAARRPVAERRGIPA